jgi:argininosuccinate lyase
LMECLEISHFMLSNVEIKKDLLNDSKYDMLFSVENVNELVVNGTPFRDAYKIVGGQIEEGNYIPNRSLNHILEGSIGNLCNDQIELMMQEVLKQFEFEKVDNAIERLLNWSID